MSATVDPTASSNATETGARPPDARSTSAATGATAPSGLATVARVTPAVHPASSPDRGTHGDEQSVLEAPTPRFANSRRSSRPASYSSLSSNSSHRVQLGGRSSPAAAAPAAPAPSPVPAPAPAGEMYTSASSFDLNASAQEELLAEQARDGKAAADPYSFERPLDSVNRYSRLYEAAPLPVTTVDRRASRLPPGVSLLDPFGYGVSADPSPYDSALIYGAPSSTSQAQVRSSSSARGTSSSLGSPYPSSSSMSAMSLSSLSGAGPTSSAATSPLPWTGPDADRKRASTGDLTPAWQAKGSARNHPGMGRSKLSGEIEVDTTSQTESGPPSPVAGVVIPTDHDYTHSRLFQRTLKAQKALEKERAKGKLPAFDPTGGTTSRMDRRQSSVSFLSDTVTTMSKGRRSLGWFRSASEVALPSSAPLTPALPSSQSVSQLNYYAPSPDLSEQAGPLPRKTTIIPPVSRIRAGRASASSSASSFPHDDGQRRPQAPSPLPRAIESASHPHPPSPGPIDPRSRRTRTTSAASSRSQSQGTRPSSRSQTYSDAPLPPSPPIDSNKAWPTAPAPTQPNGKVSLPDGYSKYDQPPATQDTNAPEQPGGPFSNDESRQGQPKVPSPASSESSNSPTTPTHHQHHQQQRPSLPPGASAPKFYGNTEVRERKSSLSLLFGGGKDSDRVRRANQASLDDAGPTVPYATRAPAKTATVSKGGSFFGRAKRTLAAPSEPLRATVAPLPSPAATKLSRSKGSFFATFGRSSKSSEALGRKDTAEKALPPMPMPAPMRNGGPHRHDPRQLVSAGP